MSNDNIKPFPLPVTEKEKTKAYPWLHKAGSFDNEKYVVSKKLQNNCLRHVARNAVPRFIKMHSALYAIIQGLPGTGKSMGVLKALLDNGVDVMMVPSSTLSGATEGASVEALDEIVEDAKRRTKESKKPCVIVLDDYDLAIDSPDEKTESTINSNLLIEKFQYYASHRKAVLNALGTPIPFFFLGNDFSLKRESLFRTGRATFYTHAPTLKEKQKIATTFFPPTSPVVEKKIHDLVADYADQPISFFNDLRSLVEDDHLDVLIAEHGLNIAAIEKSPPPPLSVEMIRAAAERLAANKAGNYLINRENDNVAA